MKDTLYIYYVKRSCIQYEWNLSSICLSQECLQVIRTLIQTYQLFLENGSLVLLNQKDCLGFLVSMVLEVDLFRGFTIGFVISFFTFFTTSFLCSLFSAVRSFSPLIHTWIFPKMFWVFHPKVYPSSFKDFHPENVPPHCFLAFISGHP